MTEQLIDIFCHECGSALPVDAKGSIDCVNARNGNGCAHYTRKW